MQILSQFEQEELIGMVLDWWHLQLTQGVPAEKKPQFVKYAERYASRLPGTSPCKRLVKT